MNDSVCIMIPVKDEESGIKFLIDEYQISEIKNNFDISFVFIIDDRSSDSSKKIANQLSNNILDQKQTTGKGAAIKQAINFWEKNIKSKYVIFMDGDGSYSFNGVESVLNELIEGSDVVSGSRFLEGENPIGMSRLHIFGNNILSKISSIKNKRKISDLCTGLWGFTEKSIKGLTLKSNGFDLEAELMGKCRINKLSHKEVGIKWSSRKGGSSKLKSFQDGFIILIRILRT